MAMTPAPSATEKREAGETVQAPPISASPQPAVAVGSKESVASGGAVTTTSDVVVLAAPRASVTVRVTV